jgi:hypothetical protein
MISMKARNATNSPVRALIRDDACVRERSLRALPSEKRLREADMSARTGKRAFGESPAAQLLVEALAALVLLVAILLVLLAPE